ncbi:hypothetical protein KA062_02080 [Patescibacteria group bacterium]|jgi:hypothetical protein|nr:hypothetical protein [Patescibacteria group bacterium]
MFKKPAVILISLLLLIGMFSLTYLYFSKYQPKALKKIPEVKGLRNINTDDFPYPSDAVKIGTNKTLNTTQTTFTTKGSLNDTVEFYKKFYTQKNWNNVNEKSAEGTTTISFRKDSETVNIVLTTEKNDGTVVSLESVKE